MSEHAKNDVGLETPAGYRYGDSLPSESAMLEQLLKLTEIQQLFESYLKLLNIPVAIVDLNANVLLSSRWRRLCVQFHRAHPLTCQRCVESDTDLADEVQRRTGGYAIYSCPNGLTDCAAPIIIDGKHIANVFVGQFLTAAPDEDWFRRQAEECGFDVNEYLTALREVPIISEEKIPAILDLLARMTRLVTTLGVASKRAIDTQARQTIILNAIPQAVFWKDLDGRYLGCNVAFAKSAGLPSPAEVVGKTDFDLPWPRQEAEAYRADDHAVVVSGQPRLHIVEPLQKADGSRIVIDTCKIPLVDPSGKVYGVVGIYEDITALKQGEALRESEARLRDLFDNSSDLIQSMSKEGRLLFVNNAWHRTLGYSAEEVAALNMFDIIDEECREHCNAVFQRLIRGENVGTVDLVLVAKDGRRVELEGHVNARFVNGECVATRGIFRDVTDHKRTMAALLEKEEDLSAVLEASPEAIGTVNILTGLFEGVNEQSERLFGLSRTELEKVGPAQMSPDFQADGRRSVDAASERINAALEGALPIFEWTHRNAQGDLIPCEVRLVALPAPRHHLVRFSVTDVSQRKRDEDELKKLTRAIEQSPTVVVITNMQGAIEYVNPRFTELTGYTSAEALGRNPRILKSGTHAPEFYKELWATLAAGKVWHGELNNRKKNGELYWESAAITPIKDRQGKNTHYVAVKEDITRRKSAEEELRRAKEAAEAANQAKSIFLANMSHEIRTPMNAVIGFSQLLLRDPATTPAQSQYLEAITRAGDHLLSLIDEILQLAKIESGRITLVERTFDLHTLLTELDTIFGERARAKRVRWLLEMSREIPQYVVADDTKLRQVLSNLLGNAVKFTESGGVVLRVALRGGVAERHLIVEVDDTGPGIAPEEMSRLFEKFEQTESGRRSKQGTGLGLAISRELARLMGGDVTASSQLGQGSVFRVELPLKEGTAADVVSKGDPRRVMRLVAGQPAFRVLVVDDQEENRALLIDLLTAVGFETRQAASGEQAVALFGVWQPHLVLMDMRMPVVDGAEAIRRIRAAAGGGAVKIISLTASAFEENRELALDAGADDFVSKPLREGVLFEKIQTLLGVAYECADATGAVAAASPEDEVPLTREALAAVPPELREQIRQATLSADLDRLLVLLQQVEAHDADVAARLRALAGRFEYRQILAALHVKEEEP